MEEQSTIESVLNTLRELYERNAEDTPRPESPTFTLTEETERAIR